MAAGAASILDCPTVSVAVASRQVLSVPCAREPVYSEAGRGRRAGNVGHQNEDAGERAHEAPDEGVGVGVAGGGGRDHGSADISESAAAAGCPSELVDLWSAGGALLTLVGCRARVAMRLASVARASGLRGQSPIAREYRAGSRG